MGVGPAGHIHHIGAGELVGVAVGRGNEPADAVILVDELAAHLHILAGDALDGLHRRVVAQRLFRHPHHHPGRVLPQHIPLVAVAHQRQRAVADEVDGGFVAGQQQQRGVDQHLLAGEHAGLFAAGQHRNEVVGRPLEALFHHRVDIFQHRLHPVGEFLHPVGFAPGDVQQLLGDAADDGALFLGDAHHIGDDQHRQRRRQIAHHIEVALRLRVVQQIVDGRLHQRAPFFHGLGGEVGMHHLAHFQVFGAVVLDELLPLVVAHELVQVEVLLHDGRVGRARVVQEHGAGEQLVVAGQPHQVVVPGNHPQLIELVPVHRVFIPQTPVVGVGVMDNIGGKHIVGQGRYHNSSHWDSHGDSESGQSNQSPRRCQAFPRRLSRPCAGIHPDRLDSAIPPPILLSTGVLCSIMRRNRITRLPRQPFTPPTPGRPQRCRPRCGAQHRSSRCASC